MNEPEKRMVDFTDVKVQLLRLTSGCGLRDDWRMLVLTLQFCIKRHDETPSLGFTEDLMNILEELEGFSKRINDFYQEDSKTWISPFMKKNEQFCIYLILFLVEYQYSTQKLLNTSRSLEDQFNEHYSKNSPDDDDDSCSEARIKQQH